jgi:hypothetical protein
MHEAFVPLVRSATPRPQVRLAPALIKIIQAAETKPPFSPLAEKPVPAREPKITLQRDGETVTGIQVQCACGQVIDLSCAY